MLFENKSPRIYGAMDLFVRIFGIDLNLRE